MSSVHVDADGYLALDPDGYVRVGEQGEPCCCDDEAAPYVQLVSCCDSTAFSAVTAAELASLGLVPPAAGVVLRIAGGCWRSLGLSLTAAQVESLNLIVWDEFVPGISIEVVPGGCAAEECECPEPCCVEHLRCEDFADVTFPPCVECDCEPCGGVMLFVLAGSARRDTRGPCFFDDSGGNAPTSEYRATFELVVRVACEVVDGLYVRTVTTLRNNITWDARGASMQLADTGSDLFSTLLSWWGAPARCGSSPTAPSIFGIAFEKYIPSGAGSEIVYLAGEDCSATYENDDENVAPVGREAREYASTCGGGAFSHTALWHEQFNGDCERDRYEVRARWRWVRVAGCDGARPARRPAAIAGADADQGGSRGGCGGCQDGGL